MFYYIFDVPKNTVMETLVTSKKEVLSNYKKVAYEAGEEKLINVRLDREGVNRAESRRNLLFFSLSYIGAIGAFIYWLV